MAKKIYSAVASCITVILALTFGELPSKAAIHDQPQRQAHRDATSRRNRAARKRVRAGTKEGRRRLAISYVCPMHLDIRSNSRGTCPKCLMDLVAERRSAKVGRR
jgi:Heavy metal binding domain